MNPSSIKDLISLSQTLTRE